MLFGRIDPRLAENGERQRVRARAELGDAQVLALEIIRRLNRAGLPGIEHLRLARRDAELTDGLDLLAEGVEHHRVHVGARPGVHIAGEDLVLGRLPRPLVDQGHVQMLIVEIPELLGEHVRQVDLLGQTADHDLERDRLDGTHGRWRRTACGQDRKPPHRQTQPAKIQSHRRHSFFQILVSVLTCGRHRTRRFSSAVIRASATSAMAASSAIPAKTPLASKFCSAL